MLESEERKTQAMQDDLLANVSSLVTNFTSQRNKSLREAGQSVRKAIEEGMDGMKSFSTDYATKMDSIIADGTAMGDVVSSTDDNGRAGAEELKNALDVVAGEVRNGLTSYQHSVADALNEQTASFKSQKESLDVTISGGPFIRSHFSSSIILIRLWEQCLHALVEPNALGWLLRRP